MSEGNDEKKPIVASNASRCHSLRFAVPLTKKNFSFDSVANNIIKLSSWSYAEGPSNYDVQRMRSMEVP
jgi:hypothetical protein